MQPATLKTLDALRKNKRKGITFDNFRTGFRLSAQIFNLRQLGYEILTERVDIGDDRKIAKYFLIKEI